MLTRFGIDVTLAYPEGYGLIPEIEHLAREHASQYGGRFTRVDSMAQAFTGADVVYPKSWAPYQVMQRRTELLKHADKTGLAALEKECLTHNARFRDWECNAEMMKLTMGGNALYMHCLPADISGVSCERGEVSAEVFEKYRLATYHEAGFKPFVIAAMIWAAVLPNPVERLKQLLTQHEIKIESSRVADHPAH